jgi:hypothetical protein
MVEHLKALERARDELDGWGDYEESESSQEHFPEAITGDKNPDDAPHPIWLAIVNLQDFYPKNRLPKLTGALDAWINLLKYSRGHGAGDRIAQRDLAATNASILREWVCGEIERLKPSLPPNYQSSQSPLPSREQNLARLRELLTAFQDAYEMDGGLQLLLVVDERPFGAPPTVVTDEFLTAAGVHGPTSYRAIGTLRFSEHKIDATVLLIGPAGDDGSMGAFSRLAAKAGAWLLANGQVRTMGGSPIQLWTARMHLHCREAWREGRVLGHWCYNPFIASIETLRDLVRSAGEV